MTAYREAGVDVAAGEELVDRIRAAVQSTWGAGADGEFGGFAGGIAVPPGYQSPVIVMSTDGCGTKAEVARQAGLFEGLGFDLVASCIDDLAAAGARPLALTDYLTVGKLDVEWATALIESIAAACRSAGVALLGGETAEHPGVMEPDEFDLAGTAIGVMEAGSGPDSQTVAPGDVVLALPSPNVRANGFSLIRSRVIPRVGLTTDVGGSTLAEMLLEPSVIYSPTVMAMRERIEINAMAHITGGGIGGNVKRVLSSKVDAVFDSSSWATPPVFDVIQSVGQLNRPEMFDTFNMGLGFVMIVAPDTRVEGLVQELGVEVLSVGVIESGSGEVRIN